MVDLSAAHWVLLAQLADGRPHHVQTLAQTLRLKPQQLNAAWQQMPAHIRGLLRQHDGRWRLVHALAVLAPDDVCRLAAQHGFQATLIPQTTSTNNVLLEQAHASAAAAHAQVCVSYEQSAGRGRQGRQWQSRLGECLMMSLAWAFDVPQAQLGGLALVVALAACRALRQAGVAAQIKWPNDLVLGNDKLGGILIEVVRQNAQSVAVIGMGLNFVLPKGVAQASAVQTVVPQAQAQQIYHDFLGALAHMLPEFASHGLAPFLADYQQWHRDQGHKVHLLREGKPFVEGTVLGIADNGALRLHSATGEAHFVSGEISLRAGTATTAPPAPHTPPRCLLLDAGNSKLKWAWVINGVVKHEGRAAYHDLHLLQEDWQQHGRSGDPVIGCAVCGEAKQQAVAAALAQPIEWLSAMANALGIRNHYHQIAEHGADRWFNILGSRRFSQHACVVISSGTAVTIDALTDDNHYLGGSILPGFHLMKEALAQRTANLNRPLGRPYAFATTTANALASGIMDAVCGAIVLMHARLQAKVGADKPVDIMLTGGGAGKVAQALPSRFVLDNHIEIVDNLVIYGLLNWVEHK